MCRTQSLMHPCVVHKPDVSMCRTQASARWPRAPCSAFPPAACVGSLGVDRAKLNTDAITPRMATAGALNRRPLALTPTPTPSSSSRSSSASASAEAAAPPPPPHTLMSQQGSHRQCRHNDATEPCSSYIESDDSGLARGATENGPLRHASSVEHQGAAGVTCVAHASCIMQHHASSCVDPNAHRTGGRRARSPRATPAAAWAASPPPPATEPPPPATEPAPPPPATEPPPPATEPASPPPATEPAPPPPATEPAPRGATRRRARPAARGASWGTLAARCRTG
jgi:hypothetical protein